MDYSFHPWMIYALVKAAKILVWPAVGGGGWLGRRWLLSRSKYWPIVQGHVQGITRGVDGPMCVLSYSYTVNGEYYSGELPLFKSRIFRNEDDVRAMLPVNASIDVRVSPMSPERSVGVVPEMILQGGVPLRITD